MDHAVKGKNAVNAAPSPEARSFAEYVRGGNERL